MHHIGNHRKHQTQIVLNRFKKGSISILQISLICFMCKDVKRKLLLSPPPPRMETTNRLSDSLQMRTKLQKMSNDSKQMTQKRQKNTTRQGRSRGVNAGGTKSAGGGGFWGCNNM